MIFIKIKNPLQAVLKQRITLIGLSLLPNQVVLLQGGYLIKKTASGNRGSRSLEK